MNKLAPTLAEAFSQAELLLLQQQLIYAAGQQQKWCWPRQRLTFHELARLLHWWACYITLAQIVAAALGGQSGSPVLSAGSNWLEFLRCERYRAEAALHHLNDKRLPDEIKQDLLYCLAIEARLYQLLLDQSTGESETPAAVDMVPLLFISLPKTLIKK